VRARTQGFTSAAFRCLFTNFPPMVGYAATFKIRSADPPTLRGRTDAGPDWWNHVLGMPAPRVVVVQDTDEVPGTGAFLSSASAHVLMAMGCVGGVTNGAARELPGIEESGFQVFAGGFAVSHAYVRVVGMGCTVGLGGLTIHPGDLIHGDRHGILTIPHHLAAELPAVAKRISEETNGLVELSQRQDVPPDELGQALRKLRTFKPDRR
jgi:4-hydroxy-4-methyl-2-oxoglutarate aldolase